MCALIGARSAAASALEREAKAQRAIAELTAGLQAAQAQAAALTQQVASVQAELTEARQQYSAVTTELEVRAVGW